MPQRRFGFGDSTGISTSPASFAGSRMPLVVAPLVLVPCAKTPLVGLGSGGSGASAVTVDVAGALSARQRTVSGASGELRAGLAAGFDDVAGFGGVSAGDAVGG